MQDDEKIEENLDQNCDDILATPRSNTSSQSIPKTVISAQSDATIAWEEARMQLEAAMKRAKRLMKSKVQAKKKFYFVWGAQKKRIFQEIQSKRSPVTLCENEKPELTLKPSKYKIILFNIYIYSNLKYI